MRQKKYLIAIFLSSIFICTPLFCSAYNYSGLDYYARYFYNRYAKHFDNFGLTFKSPEYEITDWKTPTTPREYISLATYYKYRSLENDSAASAILKNALNNAYDSIVLKNPANQSFKDAEAFFLIIRALEENPGLIKEKEKNDILKTISLYAKKGILANDTENRAIISAAHWQYIINYMEKTGIVDNLQANYYSYLIKNKIDQAISKSITSAGWYLENNFKDFSVHYHTVSAFMLMVYSDLTRNTAYLNLAQQMYYNIKKISFKNGLTEAQLGHRPLGLGAQFYLMQGLLGKYFDDTDYSVYLFFAFGHRFFSDKDHPDRLEYHSTLENTKPQFHDDYAFSDKAELAMTISKLQDINYNKYYFDNPINSSNDQYFNINNNGKTIIINDTKNVLGSYGNWSHLYNLN